MQTHRKTYQAAAVSAATTALERKIIIGILAVTAVFLSWEGTSKLTGYSSRDDVVEVVLELGNDVAGLSLPFGFRVAVAAAELPRAWRMCLSVRYPRKTLYGARGSSFMGMFKARLPITRSLMLPVRTPR